MRPKNVWSSTNNACASQTYNRSRRTIPRRMREPSEYAFLDTSIELMTFQGLGRTLECQIDGPLGASLIFGSGPASLARPCSTSNRLPLLRGPREQRPDLAVEKPRALESPPKTFQSSPRSVPCSSWGCPGQGLDFFPLSDTRGSVLLT